MNLTIVNPGFESPVIEPDTVAINQTPGWSLYNPYNVVDGNDDSSTATFHAAELYKELFYPQGVPEGNNAVGIFLVKPPGSGVVGLTQKLESTLLQPNTTYTFKFDLGNIAPSADFPLIAGFPGYAVQLRAGDEVVAQTVNEGIPPDGTFTPRMFTYTTSANPRNVGQPLEIRLLNLLQFPGEDVNFDNIRLEANPVIANGGFEEMSKLPPGLFNEAYYLQNNPDIAGAVGAGLLSSGLEHFNLNGVHEGRTEVSLYYDEASYLQRYTDVAGAVTTGAFSSGLEHFVEFGYYEGRYGAGATAQTEDRQAAYLARNADVAQYVTEGIFKSAYDHFIQFGTFEGRFF
ncbi:hypothetical protein [Argonema antarcticum]|uniref:hypothetical protein n=1 Tax=Argonema antarcticum TaxID=2942763 RepID=UPI0020133630|nr:hypothetical protein [Argonema antarcticum]MCL1469407.1 hypothetical protein [Argonema antarcticum A004/B2]